MDFIVREADRVEGVVTTSSNLRSRDKEGVGRRLEGKYF